MKLTHNYSKKFIEQLWKKSQTGKSISLNKKNGSLLSKKEVLKMLD